MPCSRASLHVIRPFPFVSHRLSASPVLGAPAPAVGSATYACPLTMTIFVDEHPDRTPSRARASRASTVSPYFLFTATTRPANQQRFVRGIHSPASFPLFWCLFTAGPASVRFSRSDANRRFVPASAPHSPLS